jgi:O-antigen/teichoic acid export membrane protein
MKRHYLQAGFAGSVELATSLLTAGLSIRFLGLEDAGFFLFFESLMRVNGGLFNLGFQSAVTKHAGQALAEGQQDQARRFFEVGMSYDLIVVLLPCMLLLGLAPLVVEWSGYSGNPTAALTYIYLSCAALILSKCQQVFTTGLMIRHAYGVVSSFRIGANILSNVMRIGILLCIPSLPALGATNAAVLLLGGGILATLCVRQNGFVPRLRFARKELSQLWNFSKWEYIWSLCSMLTSNMDRILIVNYLGLGVLPVYSMAKRVLTLGHRFIAGFTDYLFPMLSGQSDANRATMLERMDYSLRWALYGAAALIYGSASILGPTFLNLVVGHPFGTEVQPYIIAFSAVGFVSLIDTLPYHAARANGQTHINTIIRLGTTAVVFTSIWWFAKQDNLLMVVLCQGFHLPILILHNRWALGYTSLSQACSRVCLPAVGFVLATFIATCSLIFIESRIPLTIIAISLCETLLILSILAVIICQYRSGKNQQIRDLLQSLLNRSLATARVYFSQKT